jgi:RimJ/RimL family protein N-acetyltransferase
MVGTLTVYIDANHNVHHCGILVDPNAAKRGFGRKAWVALTRHICPNLGARKVVAGALESNIAMIKLFEISGMRFEARLCAEKQYDGKLHDVLIYSRFCSQ